MHGSRIVAALAAVTLIMTGAVTVPAAAAAQVPGWLSTKGSAIITASGSPYIVKAVSWFGMETTTCAPHGLWTISLDEGMRNIAGMGFNAIRLPFSNECLASSLTTSIDSSVNPDLVSLTPLQLMDAVIARAKANGLSVILDRHRPDSAAQSELWYTDGYSEKRWIDDWKMLAARYKDEPSVIGADLHNEPRGAACWNCGDPARDWRAAAIRAGDAVLSVNPRWLIIVEGVQYQGDGSATLWGGGLKDVGSAPVTLSVANRVVYSPHDYPASVSTQPWFSAPDYPANLEAVWDANWGYLAKGGIAPVLLGEFGTSLSTASDAAWLNTLVEYLARTRMSFAYWSFNPNSGDTGGLVADDWRTRQTAKLDALAPLLVPSAVPGSTPTPTPAPTSTARPSATPKPTSTPRPTATATAKPTATPKPTSTPRPTASATPKPTSTPRPTATATPKPTSSPKPSATPSATPAKVTATWEPKDSWGEGYVAEIVVTATSSVARWSVSFDAPETSAVTHTWGMTCTVLTPRVICTGADWAATLAPGQSVRVGLQAAATRAPTNPPLTVTAS